MLSVGPTIHRTRVGWRPAKVTVPFGSGSRNPIWASGHVPRQTGRTHDRNCTDAKFSLSPLVPRGPSTHALRLLLERSVAEIRLLELVQHPAQFRQHRPHELL